MNEVDMVNEGHNQKMIAWEVKVEFLLMQMWMEKPSPVA